MTKQCNQNNQKQTLRVITGLKTKLKTGEGKATETEQRDELKQNTTKAEQSAEENSPSMNSKNKTR